MVYASRAALVAAFGASEITQLETRGVDVEAAIRVAEAEVDSYLSGRYRVPVEPPTSKLTRVVCDLARYQLFRRDVGGRTERPRPGSHRLAS